MEVPEIAGKNSFSKKQTEKKLPAAAPKTLQEAFQTFHIHIHIEKGKGGDPCFQTAFRAP